MAKAEKTPRYPDYVFPTLNVIRRRGGSATIEEIEDGVAEEMRLPDEFLSIPHGETGRTEFQYKLAWVRTYLKKVGAIDNSARAVWSITDYGERMTEAEAREVFSRVTAERNERKATNPVKPSKDDAEVDEPDENWLEETLKVLGGISPDAFERLAQRLLRESGFIKVEVTGRSSDGGIDGIGVLRVNLVSFHVLFQCKRWKSPVGAPVVRDFRGAMVGRADKGLVITTSTFTAEARKEATRDGAPAIDLIDGETLCGLLKDKRLGIDVRMVEEIDVDPKFFASI